MGRRMGAAIKNRPMRSPTLCSHFSGEEHGEWRRLRAEVLTSSLLLRAGLLTARDVSSSPLVVDQTCAEGW